MSRSALFKLVLAIAAAIAAAIRDSQNGSKS
jgi:hypothetical protein